MQGASVKQTRSVCSERARTPAGGRSRCVFAEQIRGFSAQALSPILTRCRSASSPSCPTPKVPKTAENRTLWGRGIFATSGVVNLGRGSFSYPLASDELFECGIKINRNKGVAKRAPSQIDYSGELGLTEVSQAETTSRNRASKWDAFSARPFSSKTHVPSIAKLGRRRPKRNGRRST